MNQQDSFDLILASLYRATIDESLWPATAGLIDEACGVRGSMLLYGQGRLKSDALLFTRKFCMGGVRRTDLEDNYFGTYYLLDERVPRIRDLPDSELVHVEDLYTAQEKKTSLAYNECLPLTHTRDSLHARLDGPGALQIVWHIADPIESGGWRNAQVDLIRRLLPHVRNSVCLQQVLVDAEAVGLSLTKLLDNTRCGVVQLDRNGRIGEMNDSAAAILRAADGLHNRSGFLKARTLPDNVRLQTMLADALPKSGNGLTGGSETIGRKSFSPRLVLHVIPVAAREEDGCAASVAAVVLIVDPGTRENVSPGLLEDALGLTAAEGRVAASLASGLCVRDIALSTGRRESTVRWHMQHIFEKQGITRQAELVQRVQALGALPF